MTTINGYGPVGPTAVGNMDHAAVAPSAGGKDDPSLLPAPSDAAFFGSDPVLTLGSMMIEHSRRQREIAQRSEQAADARQIADEEKEAHDLHDEASSISKEGWVEGACAVASGAAQIVAAKDNMDAETLRADAHNANNVSADAAKQQYVGAWYGASAKAADATGHTVGNFFRASQKDAEATQKDDAARADEEKRFADNERGMLKEADDQIDKVLGFMRSFIDSQHQARMATLQGVRG